MKEKMKIFKEIIILTIINAVLISIISGIGRIIVLNIMQNLDSTNDMRNTYIMYFTVCRKTPNSVPELGVK